MFRANYDKNRIMNSLIGGAAVARGSAELNVGAGLRLEDVAGDAGEISGVHKACFLVAGAARIGAVDEGLNSGNVWHFVIYIENIFYFYNSHLKIIVILLFVKVFQFYPIVVSSPGFLASRI